MGKGFKVIIIGLIGLMLLLCIPLSSGEEYPDFPKNKMVLVGHYSIIDEQESKGISRDLCISCNQGDISVYIAKWWKCGYSSWDYARLIYDKYTYFHAPVFFGICRNGQIFGITYGDLYYS